MKHIRTCWLVVALLSVSMAVLAFPGARKDLTVEEALKPWLFGGQTLRKIQWTPDGRSFTYFGGANPKQPSDLMVRDTATLASSIFMSQARFRAAFSALSGVPPEEAAKASFTDYDLSPKGRYLLLTSGDCFFVWDIQRQALRRVTTGEEEAENAVWSPDESRVAFTAKGSLWVWDRSTGAKTLLAKGREPLVTCGSVDWLYGEELDMTTGFWWSPDSSRIAYLRFDESGVPTYPIADQTELTPGVRSQFYPKPGERNPAVSLNVITLEDGGDATLASVTSEEGYLPRVTWLSDSKGLAYEVVNRNQDRLVLSLSGLEPGSARTVLEETDKTWVNVMEGPRFLKDGRRFLWLSERDGYAHLYLADLSGELTLLTPGPWVVDEIMGVDEKAGWVYFTGNRESPLGRQFYRADLKGKKLERLTREEGWHDVVLSPSFDNFVDSGSSSGVPDVLTMVSVKGDRRAVLDANPAPDLTEYGFVKPEFITLKAEDGTTLYAKIIKPRDFDPSKKYPAIVEVYGGPHAQMVQDRWVGRWDTITQLFVQAGFVSFTVDNRGAARRGKAFEDVLMKRLGKTELEDQLAGLAVLKKMPYVDPDRVGIWGWSYGGFMTAYALTHAPAGSYACGVSVAPVVDWLNYDSCYTERYLKLPAGNPAGYKDSSPVHDAGALAVPYLLMQGLVDDNVHFGNSAQLADAFYKAHKPFQMAYYPRMDHGIRGPDARRDLFTRMLSFFNENLGDPAKS